MDRDQSIFATPADRTAGQEGQILAQRKVLGLLVAIALKPHDDHIKRLCALVSEDAMAPNHDEDPGSDPDSAFAVQAVLSEELRAIAREASRWLAPAEV